MKVRAWTLICAGTLLIAGTAVAQTTSVAMKSDRAAEESSLLDRPAQLLLRDATLMTALTRLSQASSVPVAFSPSLVAGESRRVDCDCDSVTVRQALERLLARTSFGYRELRGEVLVFRDVPATVLPSSTWYATRYAMFDMQPVEPMLSRSVKTRVAAWEVGTIIGRVTVAETDEPIANANVAVDGAGRAFTNREGRFRIPGVPAGRHAVRVSLIGYRTSTREVEVGDGATTTVDFALEVSPTALAELVVTATGEQRRLELGHVVGRINADSLVKEAPVSNISELLTGRVPGLQVFQTQGTVGGDVQLQIRTPNSLLLSSQPVVIVDGVRYTSEPSQRISGGFERTSPLNDLNPNDIATIEVVKGPAASTLYGTDASNGVIVITTKRGRPGPPRWNTYVRAGITEVPEISREDRYWAWGTLADGSTFGNCTLASVATGFCAQDSIVAISDVLDDPSRSILANAPRWEYGMNVSGGQPGLRYYVAGDMERATGPFRMPPAYADSIARARGTSVPELQLRPNGFSKINVRSNLTAVPAEQIELQANIGYVHRSNRTMSLSDNPYVSATGGGVEPGEPYGGQNHPAAAFSRMSTEEADRFLLGGRAQGRLASWLLLRAGAGVDLSTQSRHELERRGEAPRSSCCPHLGRVRTARSQQRAITAELGLTMNLRKGRVGSRSTVGAQYVRTSAETTMATGTDLIPGGESVSQATNRYADQFFTERVTLGGYFEETLSLNDRLFLTGAVRADGASAFGRDYTAAVYPKVSASWLVSEEPFLPRVPGLDELRLRYAFGASGQQALPEMALPTFLAQEGFIDGTNTTVIHVDALGNPNLRPERAREHEFGFDAAGLGNRVHLGITWFRRRVEDQIVTQDLPPGLGFIYTNVGLTTAHGFEATLDVNVLDTQAVRWDLFLRHSSHGTRLIDIGDAAEAPSHVGGYKEGYPLGGRFQRRVLGYEDVNQDGIIVFSELQWSDSARYVGQSTPTRQQALTTVFGFLDGRFRLSASLERRAGFSQNPPNPCNRRACLAMLDPSTPLELQAAAVSWRGGSPQVLSGDFTRLREITAVVELPPWILDPLRIRSAVFSVSARNLALWTAFRGGDPESAFVSGLRSYPADGIPQSRSWTFRFDLGF